MNSLDVKVLTNSGKISHKDAINKARIEYRKYQVKELSSIEKEYLNSINEINRIVENLNKK